MGERVTVEGTVENVIFHNEENGYTVLLLTVEGEEEPVTVVGCIPCAAAGEGMTVTGVWSVHPVHGSQLTAESVERRMPEREEDMIAYLSSGIIKGIGPKTAARIVEHFGEQTFLAALGIAGGMACLFGMILPPLAVLAVITQFYTAFQNNLWVAAAMRGIRAAVVPIMISAVLGMVGSAFRYPPCYAVMLLVIALYLFFNVNCVYLVVIGAVCGLLIAEFYERKGDKKHDGAA